MEIAIAVFILAASLASLIGLQAAAVQKSLSDAGRLRAMLLSRHILASIETRDEVLEVAQNSASAKEFLEEQEVLEEEKNTGLDLEGLTVDQQVQYWGLPEKPDALKRVVLSVRWSEAPNDVYTTYYFVPNDDDQSFDEESEELE